METLSRMTGKDFSGPVPEIRVPTPPVFVQPEASNMEQEAPAPESTRKKPKKNRRGHLDDGVVVVGDADSKSIARTLAASSFGRDIPQIQISSRHPDKVHNILKHTIPQDRLLPPVSLDVTKPATLPLAFRDANVVVSLVGVLNGSPKTFEEIQFKGAENVARAAKGVGAKLIHFSAIGADSQSDIMYAKTKGMAENSILHICPDATIIRPSLVFGPEDDFFNVRVLFKAVEIIARDDPHVKKLVSGSIMEAGGPEIFTFKQLMELTLKYNKRNRPIISIPYAVGLLQGAIFEKLPTNLLTVTRDQFITYRGIKLEPTGAGVISDISEPKERGSFYGMFVIGPMVGPAIGPVIGGALSQHLGWRSIFWFLCISALICLVMLILFLPETLRSIVGDGSVLPSSTYRPVIPIIRHTGEPCHESVSPTKGMQNPLRLMVHVDIIILLALTGLVCAVYYGYIATISTLFVTAYPFLSETAIGLCYLAVGGGMAIGSICHGKLLDWEFRNYSEKVRLRQSAEKSPEPFKTPGSKQNIPLHFPIEQARLRAIPPLLILLVACSAGYGWCIEKKVHLAAPLIIQVIGKVV
ncbi:hypothetical protein C0993_003952 [Termitomyces sp. T159_Od127]|nr:hypothetical protein C0993_003952 [Termitomyces sp. T159_Od127]